MLLLQGVSKRYGRLGLLDRVDWAFERGLTILSGPSGAGKSTLLRMLATAERPSSGQMSWNGARLPRATKAVRTVLGYAPQAVDLPETLTAREFGMHIAALKGLELKAADAQFLGICDAIGLHADVHKRIASFSGGMRRRLIFAQSLLGSPALLVLDEPTAELDRETADSVADVILRAAERTVAIMTTHMTYPLARHASAVLNVSDGRVRAA